MLHYVNFVCCQQSFSLKTRLMRVLRLNENSLVAGLKTKREVQSVDSSLWVNVYQQPPSVVMQPVANIRILIRNALTVELFITRRSKNKFHSLLHTASVLKYTFTLLFVGLSIKNVISLYPPMQNVTFPQIPKTRKYRKNTDVMNLVTIN